MIKISGVKKISGKTKKKEVKKKAGAAPVSPQKTAVKNKQAKKVSSKVKEKKPRVKKRKIEVRIQEKDDKKYKKTEVKSEPAAKKAAPKRTIKKPGVLEQAKEVTVVPELKDTKADTIPKGFPSAHIETLPSEYGENGIILMPVNPYKLFAFWEVRKETLNIFRGILNLRVYDVTGIDLDTTDADSFHDIAVSERIGKMYLDVSPAKEYIADVGIVYNGIFISIARSPRISTPGAGIPGEKYFLPEVLDIGVRIGY